MNLEQIDTSTTAGKAEVMRLAAEGRRVAYRLSESQSRVTGIPRIWEPALAPRWNWATRDYAIIAEPVGPEEVWAVVNGRRGLVDAYVSEQEAGAAVNRGQEKVKYIRADLAGEGK